MELTGLRKGELASLTVGQIHLDERLPILSLHAADEKNREGAEIALRGDLVADLRQWFAERLMRLQGEAKLLGEALPLRLDSDVLLFDVPDKLSKIFNRDLKAAGIAKIDERGRRLDVHTLHHTFGTLLSKGGVAPRTAQTAMRHGMIDLTMNVYLGGEPPIAAIPLTQQSSCTKKKRCAKAGVSHEQTIAARSIPASCAVSWHRSPARSVTRRGKAPASPTSTRTS